jgi:hypothetical protein
MTKNESHKILLNTSGKERILLAKSIDITEEMQDAIIDSNESALLHELIRNPSISTNAINRIMGISDSLLSAMIARNMVTASMFDMDRVMSDLENYHYNGYVQEGKYARAFLEILDNTDNAALIMTKREAFRFLCLGSKHSTLFIDWVATEILKLYALILEKEGVLRDEDVPPYIFYVYHFARYVNDPLFLDFDLLSAFASVKTMGSQTYARLIGEIKNEESLRAVVGFDYSTRENILPALKLNNVLIPEAYKLGKITKADLDEYFDFDKKGYDINQCRVASLCYYDEKLFEFLITNGKVDFRAIAASSPYLPINMVTRFSQDRAGGTYRALAIRDDIPSDLRIDFMASSTGDKYKVREFYAESSDFFQNNPPSQEKAVAFCAGKSFEDLLMFNVHFPLQPGSFSEILFFTLKDKMIGKDLSDNYLLGSALNAHLFDDIGDEVVGVIKSCFLKNSNISFWNIKSAIHRMKREGVVSAGAIFDILSICNERMKFFIDYQSDRKDVISCCFGDIVALEEFFVGNDASYEDMKYLIEKSAIRTSFIIKNISELNDDCLSALFERNEDMGIDEHEAITDAFLISFYRSVLSNHFIGLDLLQRVVDLVPDCAYTVLGHNKVTDKMIERFSRLCDSHINRIIVNHPKTNTATLEYIAESRCLLNIEAKRKLHPESEDEASALSEFTLEHLDDDYILDRVASEFISTFEHWSIHGSEENSGFGDDEQHSIEIESDEHDEKTSLLMDEENVFADMLKEINNSDAYTPHLDIVRTMGESMADVFSKKIKEYESIIAQLNSDNIELKDKILYQQSSFDFKDDYFYDYDYGVKDEDESHSNRSKTELFLTILIAVFLFILVVSIALSVSIVILTWLFHGHSFFL